MAVPAPLPEPDPSEMLAARARRGDSRAFEELYRLHHRRVYALALRKPVELRVRRGGKEMDVTVIPRLGCNMPMLAVRKR